MVFPKEDLEGVLAFIKELGKEKAPKVIVASDQLRGNSAAEKQLKKLNISKNNIIRANFNEVPALFLDIAHSTSGQHPGALTKLASTAITFILHR